MFALNFDHALFDRSACATFLFELFRQDFHIIRREHKIFYQCHCFAAASAGVAMQVGGLLLGRQDLTPVEFWLALRKVSLF